MLPTRILPAEEYDRLPLKFDPAKSIVVVAEDPNTKEIKGIAAAMGIATIECWTHEDGSARGFTALYALRELFTALVSTGEPVFYAFSDSDSTSDLLKRLGMYESTMKVFIGINPLLPQEDKDKCQQQLQSLLLPVESQPGAASQPLPSPPTPQAI